MGTESHLLSAAHPQALTFIRRWVPSHRLLVTTMLLILTITCPGHQTYPNSQQKHPKSVNGPPKMQKDNWKARRPLKNPRWAQCPDNALVTLSANLNRLSRKRSSARSINQRHTWTPTHKPEIKWCHIKVTLTTPPKCCPKTTKSSSTLYNSSRLAST